MVKSLFNHFIENFVDRPLKFNIFLHHNADPDAVCSAFAFGELLRKINPAMEYQLFSHGLNISTKRIVKDFQIDINVDLPILTDTETINLTMDCSNLTQVGKFKDWVESSGYELAMIDHHEAGGLLELATYNFHDSTSPSTCILIAKGYAMMNINPSADVATLLISGHLYDSRRFIHGVNSTSLRVIADLIDMGGNYKLANEFLQNKMGLGEKIARLKACQRVWYKIVNKVIIATSNVGAFESSAARSLLSIGADIVFVIARKENEIRGSARSHGDDAINVGRVLTQLSEEFSRDGVKASGGGHKNAAGFNVVPKLSNKRQKELLERFQELAENQILMNSDEIEVIVEPATPDE